MDWKDILLGIFIIGWIVYVIVYVLECLFFRLKNNKGCLFAFLAFIVIAVCVSLPMIIKKHNEIKSEREEIALYENNSLSTGSMPYSEYYGYNQSCFNSYCSNLIVTAPDDCDVIVIVKRGGEYGPVVAHGYIKRCHTYSFSLPNGTYQTFFYMGNGWNPNQKMQRGIIGGFINDVSFSKDSPQRLDNCSLTYSLIRQVHGNFITQSSRASEVF